MPGAPPALGDGVVHVTVASDDLSGRDLVTLDAETGDVVATRGGGAGAIVTAEGGLVYMEGPQDCGASYDAIVVEDVAGEVQFRHDEPSGVRDFAPGADGELYVVNGDRELVRLSATGDVEWRFAPDCAECTVAGAPTVTDDAVYFPVWEGEPPNTGCGDVDPDSVEQPVDAVDPLYALGKDGSVKWSYDGFSTLAQRHGDGAAAMGVLGLALQANVRHHPAGRPVVADDGTLYVPADGAIVALDADGEELGFALFNPARGETETGPNTGLNTGGFAPPPTLAEDGQLTVWDGAQLRGFRTGKKPAAIPWSAPFGGNKNAGRIGR
jgi:outer membrane protein assembly factor BamB